MERIPPPPPCEESVLRRPTRDLRLHLGPRDERRYCADRLLATGDHSECAPDGTPGGLLHALPRTERPRPRCLLRASRHLPPTTAPEECELSWNDLEGHRLRNGLRHHRLGGDRGD